MLVLTRKSTEDIMIQVPANAPPCTITVSVLSVRGHIVRLGIDAPKEFRVDRDEIHKLREATGQNG